MKESLPGRIPKSTALRERALELIPGGTQTMSKRAERFVPGKWPAYWDHASGSHIWDIDGNEYIDYVMALGPILLGYSHPKVNEAIEAQLRKSGPLASLQSPLEVAVAEKLVEHIPSADMVRFFKTGAEATAAACRIVRGYTGREKMISCGYAGALDWWVAKQRVGGSRTGAILDKGVPKALRSLTFDLPYGDEETLARLLAENEGEIAGIMIDTSEVRDEGRFLSTVRERCDSFDIPLIFDEIITGFRMGLGGAQEYFGVTPDLSTFGKAMANGMPLAAVVGSRALMAPAKDLWLSSTYAGEALSLAAALAVIAELERPETVERLNANSFRLESGLREIAGGVDGIEFFGQHTMPGIRFTNGWLGCADGATAFVERMLASGILTRPNYIFFVSVSLTDSDIENTLASAEQAIGAMASTAV